MTDSVKQKLGKAHANAVKIVEAWAETDTGTGSGALLSVMGTGTGAIGMAHALAFTAAAAHEGIDFEDEEVVEVLKLMGNKPPIVASKKQKVSLPRILATQNKIVRMWCSEGLDGESVLNMLGGDTKSVGVAMGLAFIASCAIHQVDQFDDYSELLRQIVCTGYDPEEEVA